MESLSLVIDNPRTHSYVWHETTHESINGVIESINGVIECSYWQPNDLFVCVIENKKEVYQLSHWAY